LFYYEGSYHCCDCAKYDVTITAGDNTQTVKVNLNNSHIGCHWHRLDGGSASGTLEQGESTISGTVTPDGCRHDGVFSGTIRVETISNDVEFSGEYSFKEGPFNINLRDLCEDMLG
jgi:hypothetical protein